MINYSLLIIGKGTISEAVGSKGVGVQRPMIFWNVTFRCNLRCVHCYIDAGRPNDELSGNDLRRLIGEMASLNPSLVVLTGGEPLIRDDIFDIIAELRRRGLKVALSSNGTLINEELAREIASLGVAYVGISLESPNPDLHERIRGVEGCWETALRGIKALQRLGVPVGIRTLVTRENIDWAHEMVYFAERHGIERVVFYYLVPTGRGRGIANRLPTQIQIAIFVKKLIEAVGKAKDVEVLTVDNPSDGLAVSLLTSESEVEFEDRLALLERRGKCTAGVRGLAIYPNGIVYPCQFMNYRPLGNALNGLRRIWERPDENEWIIERLRRNELYCDKCPFAFYCIGCRARAELIQGDPMGLDVLCSLKALYEAHVKGLIDLKPWQTRILEEFHSVINGEKG